MKITNAFLGGILALLLYSLTQMNVLLNSIDEKLAQIYTMEAGDV